MVRWLLALGISLVALGDPSPAALHRYEAVEPHMGTLVRITVYTPDEQTGAAAFRAAFNRIRDLDAVLSDYRAASELNQITKSAIRRPMPVSDDLFAVLCAAQGLAHATDGAFDITQGPIIRLWREARKTALLPDPAALTDAADRSGFRKLHLDKEHRTVMLDTPGMALDVGAIGKGYAASEAIKVLDTLGVRRALVAMSGDLAFSDAPPNQRGWRVAVRSADLPVEGVPHVLELTRAAVSTAGSSEQHVNIGGRRYSHIINPASGTALIEDITVTVIARNGLDADGLDTAVSVLGAERGLALIESTPGAAAFIVSRSPTGTTVRQSSRFLKLSAQHESSR
jgi:thiamine biosynthesis lipoprotein